MSRAGFGGWSRLRKDKVPENLQVHPCQVACASLDAGLECSSSDEDEVSLAPRESCADSLEVSLQPVNPSEWRLAAYGGFLRDENIIVVEARSILYAVRNAESFCSAGTLPDPF